MSRSSSNPVMPIWKRRNGFSVRGLLIALAVLAGLGGLVWYTFPSLSFSSQDTGPILHTVAKGDFAHDITERGNVESASNVDIRCEVESRGSQGTMILELIEEGTYVEPGDVLCKLDSSSLEQELVQQQIICNTSEAAVIQARNNYETAVIAKDEYLLGTYEEQKQGIDGKIFVAEEALRRAEQTLDYTQKLFDRGYVTELAVEADEFAVKDATKKLEQAKTEMRVLEEYTKEKMVKQLDADIKTTEAKLKSEEHSYKLDLEKRDDVEAQVEKCTIVAPDYGQVVYANVTDRRGGSEIIIEEGGSIRERQVIFRLPDPNRMQVKAKINEASVSMVTEGMLAAIRLDAFPDLELKGDVEKVNEYPVPTSFFSGNVKEYETTIRIDLPNQEQEPAGDKGPRNGTDPESGSDQLENDSNESTPEPNDDSEPEQNSSDGNDAGTDPPSEEPAGSKETSDDASDDEKIEASDDDKEEVKDAGKGKPDKSGEKVQLRPGMTAEVKIRVETIPDVLQVPVQAIVEHGGKHYCLTYDKATGWTKQEVKIGSTNDKTVVIRDGLKEGDKVVMGAAKHREKVKWPKIDTNAVVAQQDTAGPQPSGDTERGGGAAPGMPNPAQAFARLDADSDGKLTEDEAPPQMKSRFSTLDKNSDGAVDRDEFTAAMKAFGGGQAAGRGPGGGGPGGGAQGAGRGPGGARQGGRPGGGEQGGGEQGGGEQGGGGPGGRPGGGGQGGGARPGGAR